jgi:hypothetical protein
MERHGVSRTHQNTHTLVIYEHEQNQIQSQTNFYRFYTHSTVPSTSPLLLCTATSHHTVPQSHRHTIPLRTFSPENPSQHHHIAIKHISNRTTKVAKSPRPYRGLSSLRICKSVFCGTRTFILWERAKWSSEVHCWVWPRVW